jgi:hypothetical protein
LSSNDHFSFVPEGDKLFALASKEHGLDLFISPPAPEVGANLYNGSWPFRGQSRANNTNLAELLQLGHAAATLAGKWPANGETTSSLARLKGQGTLAKISRSNGGQAEASPRQAGRYDDPPPKAGLICPEFRQNEGSAA